MIRAFMSHIFRSPFCYLRWRWRWKKFFWRRWWRTAFANTQKSLAALPMVISMIWQHCVFTREKRKSFRAATFYHCPRNGWKLYSWPAENVTWGRTPSGAKINKIKFYDYRHAKEARSFFFERYGGWWMGRKSRKIFHSKLFGRS